MTISRILLVFSLGLNGVLAWSLWPRGVVAPRSAGEVSLASANSGRATEKRTMGAGTVATGPVPAGRRSPLWSDFSTDQLDELIARLRAAGFPAREIKAVVMACIDRDFERRRREIRGEQENPPYWEARYRPADPKAEAQTMALYLERQRLEKKYQLTPEFFAADEELLEQGRRTYGDLPLEKLRALATLEFEFQERMLKNFAERRQTRPGESRYGSSSREWWETLRQDKLAAARAVLTPEEFAQYELRAGDVADRLRSSLELFRPSEAEYKALFAIEKNFDSSATKLTPEQARALEQAKDAQITIALGPERAADYRQLRQAGGDKLTRLMVRLDLPLTTVGTINTVRDQTLAQAKAIRTDPQLSEMERAAKLSALAQSAASRLTTTLGARGYEAYTDLKGSWLSELQTPSTSAAPVPPPAEPSGP